MVMKYTDEVAARPLALILRHCCFGPDRKNEAAIMTMLPVV
eukprot:CAMPEP_0172688444 /NCGR_PEP_ID=MMETSP1074-20121228/22431_1 /TAXON_ID=2916 /ORGANISM="Ceratium fusus, Strain PA161109" /LENGTH=40 /DNA_ID= /DNA_START= /DNA_END= /DNA_ORIENTATION=